MITKKDKILIKNLWESKNYGAKRLISEFPKKKWSRRGLQDFLRRLRMTGSIDRAPGSGRPRMVRTAVWCELEQRIVDDAIDQWRRRRLLAWVDTEGGHIEHSL